MQKEKPVISYQLVTPEDRAEILNLLVGPFTDEEPLSQSLLRNGLCKREKLDLAKEQRVKDALHSQYGVTAKHKGHIIGSVLSELGTIKKYEAFSSPSFHPIGALIAYLYNQRFEEILFTQFVHLQLCVVHPKFQKLGIAQSMLEWTIEKARKNGVAGVVADATGVFSQNLFTKNGFRCISEVFYDEYKNSNGELVFPPKEPHNSIKLMIKEI